ncbi:DNA repair protein RecN [Guptibacillus hwajinpoensis]|uniref:DNA repair protein RecN n=1 Tax=Guptibacillus hwajinpoensis TaxID=208199 RepID=A0ABU0JXA0_9BACL|nr:DNA repair protein RecN [Alkalihalobacillus hemicentroti]MDQ0481726.1 DNA repair protein RecN (Recombination protein N) [Alkalihalobacillus hemicentroti]
MLAELSIRNFAIIEAITVSFERGLTVLTGETGAGKSIIIDAIGLLVGGRGSAEFVRYGTKKAEIEGLFHIDPEHPTVQKLEDIGIEFTDDMVVLRRDISSSGKSICRVNGKLVTLGILREIGQTLIDIHGQHEHQDLMQSDKHLSLLDQFGDGSIGPALIEYREVYSRFKKIQLQMRNLTENEQQMAHRLDLIQYQLEEITKAELSPNEDEELMEEKMRLGNFEKLFSALQDVYHSLHGDNKGLDWVGLAMSQLESVSDLDEELKSYHEEVANQYYLLEETVGKLNTYRDQLEFDPARLDFVEERLNEIQVLKRKYGESVEEILEYAASIEDEVDELVNREDRVEELESNLKSIKADLSVEADNLTGLRKTVARVLVDAIHHELRDLYMEKTKFAIHFNELDNKKEPFHKSGKDDIDFMISTNPGEPLKQLSKTASGGELSRIMLALKSIFSKHQGITSIIFDEVDTGVSGRVAQAMAEKIQRLSSGSQVLVITHLPQVAAMADHHLYISKEETGEGRTKTSVGNLSNEEQIEELGRMISGAEMTELTKKHARELLLQANQIKS